MRRSRSLPSLCVTLLLGAGATCASAQTGACCDPSTGLCTTTGDALACAALTPLAGAFLGVGAACPTVCEHEPNGTKALATVVSGMAPGDVIAGFSTGFSSSPTSLAVSTWDEWNITTTAAPSPGIWRYRLILTTTTGPYHSAFIQGRPAVNGVAGTSESTAVQTALLSSYTVGGQTLPAHTVQWYASENPSHIYYRVTGNGATTEPYTVTLVRDPVPVNVVAAPVDSGPVFVSTQGLTATNTDMWLYTYDPSSATSSNFTPVPGAGNNQGFVGVAASGSINSSDQCRLQRMLPSGSTYIAAISAANLANDLPAPSDDDVDYRTGSTILDFDNALLTYSGYTDAFANLTTTWQNRDFQIGNRCSGSASSTITNRASLPFEITFWQFTTNNANLPDTPYSFTASSALSPANTAGTLGGGTILLTVTAAWTGGPGPTVDLSAFGGNAAEPMYDDGTHGDVTAGDKKWSYNLTVPAAQTPNIYTVTFTGPTFAGQCVGQTRTVPFNVLPPNNSCANAVPIIIGGSYAGTTLGATGAGGFPTTCNASSQFNSTHGVWYTFTEGSTPHRLTANLCDPATDFNANMVLFEARPGGQCASGSNGLTCVSSSTDSPVGCLIQSPARAALNASHTDTPAILNWNPGNPTGAVDCTVPGTTYFIVVLNVLNDNVGGHFVLHLDDTGASCQGMPPTNNDVCAAKTLTNFPFWEIVFPGDALSSPQIPSCSNTGTFDARGALWYTFVPAEPGTFFHTKIPDQGGPALSDDTSISIYSGTGCASLSEELACVDYIDGYANMFTTPVAQMTAGTRYYALLSCASVGAALPDVETVGFNFVPDPGACCTAGACTMTSGAAACTSGGGTFRGYPSTCSPSPCATPSGVCCRGATCNTTVGQTSCVGAATAGAVYTTTSAACNAGSTHTPCCYADYNKSDGLSVQDIFDFLNSWFAGSLYAIPGGDGASGTLAVQNIFDFLNAWFVGGCT